MDNPCIIGGTYGAEKAVHVFAINTVFLTECKNGIDGYKYSGFRLRRSPVFIVYEKIGFGSVGASCNLH